MLPVKTKTKLLRVVETLAHGPIQIPHHMRNNVIQCVERRPEH